MFEFGFGIRKSELGFALQAKVVIESEDYQKLVNAPQTNFAGVEEIIEKSVAALNERFEGFVENQAANDAQQKADKEAIEQVEAWNTVADVKEMIEAKEGTPWFDQRLIFAGKQLEEERTLAEYNVQNNSTLDLHFWEDDGN
uniref:Ubiquitin-like domain-containing protein n=1 Tax=Globodera pallida TaxID=36090 RepID=A0A183CGH2_GLOPA